MIDGTINPGEWTGAANYSFSFGGSRPFTVSTVRDGTYLYLAATVTDSSPVNPSFTVFFDNNHDGGKATGDDVAGAYFGATTSQGNNDFFWHPTGTCCGAPTPSSSHYPDTYDTGVAGFSEVFGAGTADATGATFEIRRPLCSTDTSHDFCVSPVGGGSLGINFQYQAASTPFVRYPGSDATDPSNWADLTIGARAVVVIGPDTVPPTVTVTQPAAGSVVSGTIPVTANASDNVGVTSVEFLYFDGEGPGVGTDYSLGVDTTAPYEATFVSTSYPDTIPLDATMYAIGRDAAGNTTSVGNGITINNAGGGGGTGTVTGASISIVGNASARAGAASAPISGIPIQAIRGDQAAPSATPLGGIPLGGIPLGGIPLGGIPLGGIPLGGIGFTSTNLDQNGLGGVPLSTIPLESQTDTWQKRLDANPTFAGKPVQSVTLAEVLGTSVVTSAPAVTLGDLDLQASPLGGIPLGGIALGGLPLGGIPLGGIAASSAGTNRAAWCQFINSQPGFSCSSPDSLSNQTMLGIALQGVPLGGIPLGGIPLGGINLSDSPLGGIPLGGIELAGTPLGGIPLGGIPLGGIDLASSPLGGIPLGGISSASKTKILTCAAPFACATGTLAQAFAANAIRPAATVADIGYYCTTGSPTKSPCQAADKPISLGAFVLNGLPPNATLEDLLGTILSETAYDWESLPLPGFPIQDFSDDGGINSYAVNFTLTGGVAGLAPATVRVKIPDGARFIAKSSAIRSLERSLPDPTLLEGNELEWKLVNLPLNSSLTLVFDVKPGLTLETETATAQIEAGVLAPIQAALPASTKIRDPWAGFESIPTAVKDTLYLGYTTYGDDRDTFELAVPAPGTQVTVRLSHLALDNDLVVFGPVPPPLRTPKASTASLQAGDVGPSLQQRTQAVPPEVLGDVPITVPSSLGPGIGLLGASDNRGLADEEVTFIVPEDSSGTVTIQISSFDGAYSNEPWMLRVETSPPIALPAGPCKTPTGLGGGTTRGLPALSATGSTLYLHNSKRYGDLYGSANETAVWNKLDVLASRPVTDPARGTVVPIDAIPGVGALLGAWNGNPCSPGATNDVVRALGTYLDGIPASYKYIVLVGDWTVVPTGLVLDNSLFANERGYASTFYGEGKTQYLSSYALGYLPTDDSYGDSSYSGQGPYVPELAVGRLVEKHGEIMDQLEQYLTRNGAIDPATALVTGYDFLKDGAQQISAGLAANAPSRRELINDTWSRTDLLAALFPATNPPMIDSVNAHYDHYRALPADQNAAGTETDLFETSQLQPTPGRLVITIGCHSGTPVSDFLVAAPLAPDWSQSYAAKGAIGYIAQSGYGLGETAGVAYSEKLHALLAERLDGSLTVGQALAFAKQEYSAMPLQGGYDVKVINGAGLYGLPMYRVGSGAVPPSPPPLPLATDAATGLNAATFTITPSFTRVNATTGSFFTVGGNASFQNRRPIEPFAKLDVTQPGFLAHGALLTAAVSDDQGGFDAAFSRAIEDSAALSPELVGDATSPTRLQSIATFSSPTGKQQRLVVSTGQFLADGIPDPRGVGTQRLFRSLGGVVLFAPDTDENFTPPTFGPVQAFAASGSTIGFAVDVKDDQGVDMVKRLVALYKDGTGAWQSIDLSHAPGSTRWSGGGPFTGSTAEWFIQAADSSGNVGVISNKAHIDPVIPPVATGGLSAAVTSAAPPVNGWYTGDATVTISGGAGITSSVDGSSFVENSTPTVSGTGLHSVEYQNSSGGRGTTIVPIDTSNPTVAVKAGIAETELGQALALSGLFTCGDAGSGIASCAASGIDTSTPTLNGTTRTFTVTATDRVGRTATASGTYRVLYAFRGFFQPVDNLPVLNSVNAGRAIPTKFSLGGNHGLTIFATDYPKSAKIGCAAADPVTEIEESTVTAGNSSLSYDAASGRYHYVWKTDKIWVGTCRQLILRLADGSEHRANFKFK